MVGHCAHATPPRIAATWHAGGVQRWRDLEEVPTGFGPSVVTIGVFDGVHAGHRAIVDRLTDAAREAGLPAVVVTFDPHPTAVVRPERQPATLTSVTRRADLLEELGVDAVLVLPFTAERSQQSPEDFVREVLVERLHASTVVVGSNFRFGHRARGNVDLLRTLGEQYAFVVDGLDLVEGMSSTVVRELLGSGDVEAAARALGRPYRIEGEVVRGDARGSKLGYPTANVQTPAGSAVPADGVYAGELIVDGEGHPAAISVGTNPTFNGTVRRIEAYVLDRDDLELYGKNVGVDFVARLRGMIRFDDVDALVAQMADDVERSRGILANHHPESGS
jgi:riboflavin kinase / FMN adenylyltransferase